MFKITFLDKTTFINDDIKNQKWNDISDKPIYSIEYQLGKEVVVFVGFEKYCHIVERVRLVNKKGPEIISKYIIMGKQEDKVQQIIFDMIKKKAYKKTTVFGEEYRGNSVTGWKNGIKFKTVKPQIFIQNPKYEDQ